MEEQDQAIVERQVYCYCQSGTKEDPYFIWSMHVELELGKLWRMGSIGRQLESED